jgi:hypothetical protein
MSDPIIAAARRAAAEAFAVLRTAVDGLDATALNARPAGADTNSIAVLTTHAAKSARFLLGIAVGQPPVPRDRPAEFATTVTGPEPCSAPSTWRAESWPPSTGPGAWTGPPQDLPQPTARLPR